MRHGMLTGVSFVTEEGVIVEFEALRGRHSLPTHRRHLQFRGDERTEQRCVLASNQTLRQAHEKDASTIEMPGSARCS